MNIIKSKDFTLRPYKKGDEKSSTENINNKKISQNTQLIPYPYTLKDAKKWKDNKFIDDYLFAKIK